MKHYDPQGLRLEDMSAESVVDHSAQEAALESHLQALQDRHRDLVRIAGAPGILPTSNCRWRVPWST